VQIIMTLQANGQTNSLPPRLPSAPQKRLLGNIHTADALHALLTFFLFFQQLALAGDVAAVAFARTFLRMACTVRRA